MAKSKDHFDRKDLKEPDQFFETVGAVNKYVEENRTKVWAGIAVLTVAFLGGVGARSYMEKTRDAAAAAYSRAVSNVEYDNPSVAMVGLDALLERSSIGNYEPLAKIYRGDLNVKAENHDDAVSDFDSVIASADRDYLKQIAMMGKAFALESSGSSDDAMQLYAEAAELGGPYARQALESRARLALAGGDTAAAIAAWESVLEAAGGSDVVAERKLKDLRGETGAAAEGDSDSES